MLLLAGGVEQRASYLIESSLDLKKVEEVIYTLVSEMQHQCEATLTTILGTQGNSSLVALRTVNLVSLVF